MLGSLDIVGSRWRAGVVDSRRDAKVGGSMTLNAVNTLDNAEIYVPPFDPGSTRNGSQELDTARAVDRARVHAASAPAHSVESFRTLSLDEDYSRYGKLNWFVSGYGLRATRWATRRTRGSRTSCGSHPTSSVPTTTSTARHFPNSPGPRNIAWSDVRIGLSEMSDIKLLKGSAASLDTIVARSPGSSWTAWSSRVGPRSPGCDASRSGSSTCRGAGFYEAGQMWFDELRGSTSRRIRGSRSASGQRPLRQPAPVQLQLERPRRELRRRRRDSAARGTRTTATRSRSQFDLHRFFEATGIVLPVTFNFAQNTVRCRASARAATSCSGPRTRRAARRSRTRAAGR